MPSRVLFLTADPGALRQAADMLLDRDCEVLHGGDGSAAPLLDGCDLLLLDTHLAGTDAASYFSRHLRPLRDRPPVMLVADRDHAEVALAAVQRGIDDACFRPLCPVGTPARVAGLLSRRQASAAGERVKTLEFRNQELESFIYIVTHDMKTPVVNLQGLVALIEQDHAAALPEDVRDMLGRAKRNAHRLEELLHDLLEYPRRLRIVGPLQTEDSGAIAARAIDGLREMAGASGVEIVLAPDMPAVRCDGKRLQQVFHNLVENAVKYASGVERPRVEVAWSRAGGVTRFEVRDNGPGIAPEHVRDIFKLFHRIAGTPADGTGIGLAVARQLVEAHGGEIWCEPRPGGGTIFAFTLGP